MTPPEGTRAAPRRTRPFSSQAGFRIGGAVMSLFELSSSDDRLGQLRHLRALLSEAIDSCESGRDLAALSLRLQSVGAEMGEVAGVGRGVLAWGVVGV